MLEERRGCVDKRGEFVVPCHSTHEVVFVFTQRIDAVRGVTRQIGRTHHPIVFSVGLDLNAVSLIRGVIASRFVVANRRIGARTVEVGCAGIEIQRCCIGTPWNFQFIANPIAIVISDALPFTGIKRFGKNTRGVVGYRECDIEIASALNRASNA